MRKILAAAAAVLMMLILTAGVANAQASPPPAVAPTVQAVEVTRLPRTGTDSMPEIYLGAGLAGLGIVFVVGSRRRRNRVAAA